MKGQFEAIFCRNVTIYFDRATQGELFARLGKVLAPGRLCSISATRKIWARACRGLPPCRQDHLSGPSSCRAARSVA